MSLYKTIIKVLRRFIHDRISQLMFFMAVELVFIAVWLLYRFEDFIYLYYPVIVTCFFGVVFFIVDFWKYFRRYQEIARINEHSEYEDVSCIFNESYEFKHIQEVITNIKKHHKKYERAILSMNEERDAYYSLWAHQIKTPISALRLMLSNEDNYAFSAKKAYTLLEEVYKIEQYTDMVMHYNRIGDLSNDLLIQEYKLDDIVRTVLKKHSVYFINRRVGVELELEECLVLTDEKWLNIVIEQILSNSIKYTYEGKIKIKTFKGENRISLIIEDTGIGIREEDLLRIFDKGFTGYNGRIDTKATGIGLYLTKKILNHLGHSLGVESTVGKGTSIKIDFLHKCKIEPLDVS
ncbi:MAG: hypothetical protein CVV02_02805 [Firmicutes bacterium HGW-Firmicutes-7]|nr:MAG: hypothetical protein CVV02_02805 [Firmicutes bacterium HGW-Firmicutes-7]